MLVRSQSIFVLNIEKYYREKLHYYKVIFTYIFLTRDISILSKFFILRDESTRLIILSLIIFTLWKCCTKRSGVFLGGGWGWNEGIFQRLSRKLVDTVGTKDLDEVTRKEEGRNSCGRRISSNYGQYSRWFIYKWFTLGRLGRHDYRIGLCIFPCRCTNIKWAIWRLVKRQSANVREDILDSVKQGGKGTEAV